MDIVGNKVILRTANQQDKAMLLNLIHDPEISKVTKGYPHPVSYDHQMNWFGSASGSASDLHCIIAHKEDPATGLGIIILSNVDLKDKTAEIFIKLMKSVRKKGYGQDAVTALVSYAFRERKLRRVYSSILEYNTASRKLFEKCGFRQDIVHKNRIHEDRQDRNVCIYEISIDFFGPQIL